MPYTTVSLVALRDRLAAKWEDVPFWDDEEARLALNDALDTWGLLTGRWKRRITLDATPTTWDYALPGTLVYGMRVTYLGRPLSPTSLVDLDQNQPRWTTETVATGGTVPTVPLFWAPVSVFHVAVWPSAVAVVPSAFVVDGVSDTPRLVIDTDTVDLGEDLLSILLGMALHTASFKEAGPRFAGTFHYFQEFLAAAAEENGQIKASQVYRRVMGLDGQRSLTPTRGIPSRTAALVSAAATE